MRIILSESSYGTYVSGLSAPFTYIGRILSEILDETVKFPVKEIEIERCHFKSNLQDDKTYMEWFNKLPYYRRGKNSIHVYLPNTDEQVKLETVLRSIEDAFSIILSKKKKDDTYDSIKVQSALMNLKCFLLNNDIQAIHRQYEQLVTKEQLRDRMQEREMRGKTEVKADRLIRDIRLYYRFAGIGNLFFAPFATFLTEEILSELRKNKFRLPKYTHLYIMVSNTFDNALLEAVRYESWYIWGIATLNNYTEYPDLDDRQKQKIVFDLICTGLNDIAEIDKLDRNILNNVLDKIKSKYIENNKIDNMRINYT